MTTTLKSARTRRVRMPDYVKRYKVRGKREVTYFRRGDEPLVRLQGEYGSTEWKASYAAALAGLPQPDPTSPMPLVSRRGSFRAVIESFKMSAKFRRLNPNTARQYKAPFEYLLEEAGDRQMSALKSHHVAAMMDEKQDTPSAANLLLTVLRYLYAHAQRSGLIQPAQNPTIGLERMERPNKAGHHTWTVAELARYRAAHPIGTEARKAVELLDRIGARRSDTIRFGWQHVDEDGVTLRFTPKKTEKKTGVPVLALIDHPDLLACLADVPRNRIGPWLVNSKGRPFTPDTFGDAFRQWVKDAGLPANCTPHGIRKSFSVRGVKAGLSTLQLGAMLGDKDQGSVAIYIRDRDFEELGREGHEKMRSVA